MSSRSCCGAALEISNNFYAPEELLRKKAKSLYSDYPIATRMVAWLPMSLIGAAKLFIFPLWAVIGTLALPIIALVKKANGNNSSFLTHKPSDYMKAWGLSCLAVAGFTTFLALSAFVFPLVVTGAILVTALVVSIVIHTYRSFKEPQNNSNIIFISNT